jgi:hypothetical protein
LHFAQDLIQNYSPAVAVVLAVTGSATAIPVVLFGGFTFFRRFYNSALLLAVRDVELIH